MPEHVRAGIQRHSLIPRGGIVCTDQPVAQFQSVIRVDPDFLDYHQRGRHHQVVFAAKRIALHTRRT